VYFRESSAVAEPSESTPVAPPEAVPLLPPAQPQRSKWPWLGAWAVVVLGILVLGLRYFALTPRADPLALTLTEREGQLQIQWNHSSRSIASAVRGTLSIRDGKSSRTFPLTPQELAQGFSYKRTSGDVEVRMRVENAGGEPVEETTTFLGAAPADSGADANAKAAEKERDALQAEVERLRRENAGQAQHIGELERNLKILQSRLGAQ
jgi:hypothetical protein